MTSRLTAVGLDSLDAVKQMFVGTDEVRLRRWRDAAMNSGNRAAQNLLAAPEV